MASLALDFELTPLELLIGEVLDPNAGDGFAVPFTGWINSQPYQVLCVLERTVVYQCEVDRKLAKFAAVMVQPADIVRRLPKKTYLFGRGLGLKNRKCQGCGVEYTPLAATQLYHSEYCRLKMASRRLQAPGGPTRECGRCHQTLPSEAFTERIRDDKGKAWCYECRSEYNREYHGARRGRMKT